MRHSKLITRLAALTLIGAAFLPVAGWGTAATTFAASTSACATPSCIPDMDAGSHESLVVASGYNSSSSNPGDVHGDGIPDSINYNSSKSNTGNVTNSAGSCISPGTCDGAAKGQADE